MIRRHPAACSSPLRRRDADALLRELRGAVPSAQRIGVVEAYNGGPRISLR